jgi:hypothetical protein
MRMGKTILMLGLACLLSARFARSAFRYGIGPAIGDGNLGFRLSLRPAKQVAE